MSAYVLKDTPYGQINLENVGMIRIMFGNTKMSTYVLKEKPYGQ